jgi:hypothetical protein
MHTHAHGTVMATMMEKNKTDRKNKMVRNIKSPV